VGSSSASELLQLPVQLHGIKLGQTVDVLYDAGGERRLGVVVLCGDGIERFLVLDAAEVRDSEIAVTSAFLLLEDVDFYRRRGQSFRDLRRSA
jgi:hypothetical protein